MLKYYLSLHFQKTVSRPVSARPLSRASTPGPSDAMLELLEKIGKLSDRHDQLEERVDKLEVSGVGFYVFFH